MFPVNLASVLMLVSSYFIPAVAALLTKVKWPASVIGVIALALSTLGGFVAELQADPSYNWKHGALLALSSLAVALIAHKQLWEGDLTNLLHRVGLTGVTEDEIDMGIGYLEPMLEGVGVESTGPKHAAPVEPAPADPVAAPLVVGAAAPVQAPHPMPGPGTAPAQIPPA